MVHLAIYLLDKNAVWFSYPENNAAHVPSNDDEFGWETVIKLQD